MLNIEAHHDLRLTMETISLEANVLSNMVQTVKRMFPSLVAGVSSSFSTVKQMDKPEIQFSKLQDDVLEKIVSVSYMDLDKFKVRVPEGFNSDFLTSLEACEQGIDYMQYVKDVVVKEFRIYLSSFISNKDTKISTKDITYKFHPHASKRNAINDTFSTLYKDNSFEAGALYPDLIKRNADLKTLFERQNAITAKLLAFDIAALKTEIEDISSFIEIIIKQCQEDKVENISPEAVKNMAEGTYEIASQIETVSACYFRIKTIVVSIDDFTKSLQTRIS